MVLLRLLVQEMADEQTDIEEMKNIWRENGIMPLNFLVHSIA